MLVSRERSQNALGANISSSFDRLQNALGAGGLNLRGRLMSALGANESALLSIGRRMHWVQADFSSWVIDDYNGCRRIGPDRSILVVSNRLISMQLGAIDRLLR
jgi:hypothetical protein